MRFLNAICFEKLAVVDCLAGLLILQRPPCVQEALKEQETSLKNLENQKRELIEENSELKSTGDVLQKISQVQDEATEQLETANAEKDPHVGSEMASIGQV